MGSHLGRSSSPGPLISSGVEVTNKPVGNEGGLPGSPPLPEATVKASCPSSRGQTMRQPKLIPTSKADLSHPNSTRSIEYAVMGRGSPEVSKGYIRGTINVHADWGSRVTIQEGEWSLKREIFLFIFQRLGNSAVDLFAPAQNHQQPRFFTRYFHTKVPSCVHGYLQDTRAKGSGDGSGSTMAHETSTLSPEILGSGSSSASTNFSRHITARSNLAPQSDLVPPSHLDIESGKFIGLGYPRSVTDTVLSSCRFSPIQIYNTTWKTFIRWSRRKSVFLLTPSLGNALMFLQDGLSSGLKPVTLRQFMALSSFFQPLRVSSYLLTHTSSISSREQH